LLSQWVTDGLYVPSQARASVGVKPFAGPATFRTGPTRLSLLLDLIIDVADVGTDKALDATSDTRCKGAMTKLVFDDPTEGIGDLVAATATQAVDCLPAVATVILKNIESTGSTRARRWKFIRFVAQRFSLAGLAAPLASRWGWVLADKLTDGELAEFTIHGSPRSTTPAPTPSSPTPKRPAPPSSQPTSPPPAPPKPYARHLRVVVYGGGHVGVAFDVGWKAGRDPVTCHFFRNNVEVFTAQCGIHSSKQFYGVPAGTHSWYATVSDRFGVYSKPTNVVVRYSN
jgi:hypothetical protein